MRRHVLRTVAVGSPALGLAVLLVTTDYDLADKNAARFASETFGVANPPPHMASWLLSHPWAVFLAVLVAGCTGFLASVAIERIWLARGANQRQSYRHMWAEIGFLICVFGVIAFGLTLLRGGSASAVPTSSSAPPSSVPLAPVETPVPSSNPVPIGPEAVWAHPPANPAPSRASPPAPAPAITPPAAPRAEIIKTLRGFVVEVAQLANLAANCQNEEQVAAAEQKIVSADNRIALWIHQHMGGDYAVMKYRTSGLLRVSMTPWHGSSTDDTQVMKRNQLLSAMLARQANLQDMIAAPTWDKQ